MYGFNYGKQRTAGSSANQSPVPEKHLEPEKAKALTSEKNVTDVICVKPQIFIFNEKILKVCHSVHIFIWIVVQRYVFLRKSLNTVENKCGS